MFSLADGSVSRTLATDWEMEKCKRERLIDLFNAADKNSIGWVLEVAQGVIEMDAAGSEDGLTGLYRWIHDLICNDPDSKVLPGVLPGNKPFTMDAAIFLLDGLVNIRNRAMYHIDVQLNLETLLLKMLDRV